MARPTPTSLGSRCVPPAPGLKSIVISGSPIAMSASAITRMSQASDVSQPPPVAGPLIAAMNTFSERFIDRNRSWTR